MLVLMPLSVCTQTIYTGCYFYPPFLCGTVFFSLLTILTSFDTFYQMGVIHQFVCVCVCVCTCYILSIKLNTNKVVRTNKNVPTLSVNAAEGVKT